MNITNAAAALGGLALLLTACGQAAPAPAASSPAGTTSSAAAQSSAAAASPASAKPAASAAASGSAAAKPNAAAAAKPTSGNKLNAVYTTISGSSGPEWVADGEGLFAKQGVDVALQFLSPATLTAGIIGNSVDLGFGSPASVAAGVAQGADITIIGATYEGSTFSIMARPEIKNLQDLKGKKVAATQHGATTDFLIQRVAQQQGFKQGDINIVYIPDSAAMIPALSSGAIDAAVMSEPQTTVAANAGMHPVFSPDSQGASSFTSSSVLIVKKSSIPARRDAYERFIKACIEGVHIMKTQPDEALKYIMPKMKLDDPKVARSALDAIDKVLRDDFSVTPQGLQGVIDQTATAAPEVGKLKPQDISDMSLVEDIKASGFQATLK
jgi:NitT/TauT family transport system substrate-binding protein